MLLGEFFDYKNELMKRICKNRDILRLVLDEEEPEIPNCDLAYKQVFPYEYIPETVESGQTFICFDVDIADVIDKTYYNPVLYVWVFTYKSKLRLLDGGVRIDRLASAIDKELNGDRNFGLGTLELRAVSRFEPIQGYLGRELIYTATDFNRPGISKRPPVNRKHHG